MKKIYKMTASLLFAGGGGGGKALIISVLIVAFVLKASSQSTCTTALQVNVDTVSNPQLFTMNDTVMWFQFIPDEANCIISIFENPDDSVFVSEVFLYEGNCNNLIQVAHSTYADSLSLNYHNFVENNSYYIKVVQSAYLQNSFYLNIFSPQQISLNCPITCPNLIQNPSFEIIQPMVDSPPYNYTNVHYHSPFQYNDVCGWRGAWGSPQIVGTYYPPAYTGSYYAKMWSYCANPGSPYAQMKGEGIYTEVDICQGNTYLLTFAYFQAEAALSEIRVALTKGNNLSFNPSGNYEVPVLNFSQEFSIIPLPGSTSWTLHTMNFVANDDYDWLVIYPYQTISPQSTLFVDSIHFERTFEDTELQICKDSTLYLYVTGCIGDSYVWSGPDNFSSNLQNPSIHNVNIQNAGIYTCTITDANGCTYIVHTDVEILVVDDPVITGSNLACDTNDIWVITNYNPDYVYDWHVLVGGSVIHSIFDGGQFLTFDWSPHYYSGGTIEVIVFDPVTGCFATSYLPVDGCCRPTADYVWAFNQTYTMNGLYENKEIIIKGDPNLQGNFTFKDCRFYFEEYASLILLEGTMTFQTCKFTECDSVAWNRIYLNSINGKVTFTRDTIEHSINGIDNQHCRELWVIGCKFYNNFEKSINIDGCVFLQNPDFILISSNIIETNSNNCIAPNSGLRAKTGIRTSWNPASSKLQIYYNTFINLGNGILSSNSNLCLKHNNFINIGAQLFNPDQYRDAAVRSESNHSGMIFGLDITNNNLFDQCWIGGISVSGNHILDIDSNLFNNSSRGYGIKYNNVQNGYVNISKNVMTNIGVGVHAVSNKGVAFGHTSNIIENEFMATSAIGSATGILIDETLIKADITYLIENNDFDLNASRVIGIKLSNARYAQIKNNNIVIRNTTSQSFKNVAIESINSAFSLIYQNIITGTDYSTGSTSFGIKLQNSTSNTVQCNDIKNIGYGISAHNVCSNSTIWDNKLENQNYGLTLFDDGHISPQGSLNRHSNNKWKNVGYHTYTFYSKGENSMLYVKNAQPSNGWYLNPIIDNSHYLPQTYPYSPFSKNENAGGVFVVCPIEFIFDPKTASLGEMEALINEDIEFVEFPDVSTEFGKWQVVENAFQDTALLSSAAIQMYVDNMENIAHGKILDVREKITEDELALARQINNSIYPSSYFEEASKLYNEIMIDYAENEFQLTEDQKQMLLDLAYQCPYVYGEAVYGARALMSQYDYDLIYYLNICEIDFSQRTMNISPNQTDKISLVKVYPNPASDVLTFEFNKKDEGAIDVRIDFYNSVGSLIFSITSSVNNDLKVDISQFKNGIYSFMVLTDNVCEKGNFAVIK
jgi:hypothetical protein